MNVDIPSVQMEGLNVYAKMPRILMVTGSFPPMPCGVGDYCSGLVLGLARAGATVGVLGGHTAGLQPLDQARAFLLPALHGWRSDSLRGFVSALRRFKPNIIHFQYPTQGYGRRWMPWFLPAYAALRGIRVVVTWHEYLTRRPLRHLVGALTSNAFVVVRPEFRERLSGSMSRMLAGREIAFIPGTSAIPKCTLNDDELIRIRARFTGPQRKLVAYFGFTYPAKGTHRLFDILDPERHHLLLIGRLESSDAYQRQVLDLAASPRWRGAISLTGFQPPEQVAALLAASDAVVLPFPAGGGIWNSSLHAAMLQGTYVVATAQERQGYDESMNVFFVKPEDEVTMRMAVDSHAGRRTSGMRGGGWDEVALAHLDLYQRVQGGT